MREKSARKPHRRKKNPEEITVACGGPAGEVRCWSGTLHVNNRNRDEHDKSWSFCKGQR